ncbi:hypothetical protein [Persicobacter sp. CCB-QB2]|uniref:hypothetical protein n=1 Tax=Persicobacter sp. CCB-QB2 TaxID=1561025 RepID=UPI0006A94D43|nr:hypothetical protein [Persicobacter sp. CCB-QB2]
MNRIIVIFIGWLLLHSASAIGKTPEVKIGKDSLYHIKAAPKEGFNFDYYLFIPKDTQKSKSNVLLVEGTNTGLSDDYEHHLHHAYGAATKSSVGNFVSQQLKIPLLVPVFPRSATDWTVYTHAYDQETFLLKEGNLARLDLQLLAMVHHALEVLKSADYSMESKFFMTGFSASATFANRFSMLHPDRLKAVCGGGMNSLLMLPIHELEGDLLSFPMGISDIDKADYPSLDLMTFRELPQFWFMGRQDNNDAAQYDDAYSQKERQLIFQLLGEEMMPRWEKVQTLYQQQGVQAVFKTYPDIGHATSLEMNQEIATFFRQYMEVTP